MAGHCARNTFIRPESAAVAGVRCARVHFFLFPFTVHFSFRHFFFSLFVVPPHESILTMVFVWPTISIC